MAYKIFFSNIGYARGIDGSLKQHIGRAGRYFYTGLNTQEQVLAQVKAIIAAEKPDLCCFVEIDQGSRQSARLNQLNALLDDEYAHHDIADKYGENSKVGKLPLHQGKSNAVMARQKLDLKHLYFSHGSKRLIYKISIPGDIDVYFAHFSLLKKVRVKQFNEIREMIAQTARQSIILADFNIFKGFGELAPLLADGNLEILSREDEYTFKFHKRELALDLALGSKILTPRIELRVIPQPFSDHAALLLEIKD